MEPLCPHSKRRRSDSGKLGAGESAPRAPEATDVPGPQPATTAFLSSPPRTPSDDGGEGGGCGVDRISGLPDAILGEIVSLLPTKDAARVQTLAARWRHIWRAAPLNLNGNELPTGDEALAAAVSRILSDHPGPGRRFSIPAHHLHDRPATVDAWLRSPALDNLQELDLWLGRHISRRQFPPAPPPKSAFRYSATLRVATFSKCHFLDATVEELHFPQLSHLALEHVSISESSLHTMISSCPVLECLLLNKNVVFVCLRIISNSLKSIGVSAAHWSRKPQLREVIIVDAPCLERFLYLKADREISLSVIEAPKLETLGCLTDRHNAAILMFGTTTIQGLRVLSLTKVVCNVKILAVELFQTELDTVIELMKCFPCLEKLYIKSEISYEMNRWRRKHKALVKCFDIRLKTIVLEHYRGIRSQVNFASFFLLNARKLELMRLQVKEVDYNEAFFARQHKMLQMEKRASEGAQLQFTSTRCCQCYYLHVNHVTDLCVADPFECRC